MNKWLEFAISHELIKLQQPCLKDSLEAQMCLFFWEGYNVFNYFSIRNLSLISQVESQKTGWSTEQLFRSVWNSSAVRTNGACLWEPNPRPHS